jgi:hypothetical protein
MIKTLTLEYHSSEGGFAIFREQAPVSSDVPKPTKERAIEAFKGPVDAQALREVWPSEHSFATTTDIQFRGVFYDIEEEDAETLEALFVSLFPDATSGKGFLSSAGSSHEGLVDFVLSSDPPFEIWLSWPRHASRLAGIHYSVPDWLPGDVELRTTFRRMRIMVFGGACLVFFLRESFDRGLDEQALESRIHEVERQARGAYSTGADSESSRDIANRYVKALLDRTDEGALRTEDALEAWEVSYYSAVGEGTAGIAEPDVQTLRRIRTVAAEMRSQLVNLSRRELPNFKDWVDPEKTDKPLSTFQGRIGELQDRLQEQRIGVQDALSLVATASTAGLLRIAEEGRQQTERLQRMGMFITSFVLVPGLLATLYASGVEVPGGADTDDRTAWLGALMLSAAATTICLISLYERGSKVWAQILSVAAIIALVAIFLLFGSTPKSHRLAAPVPDRQEASK